MFWGIRLKEIQIEISILAQEENGYIVTKVSKRGMDERQETSSTDRLLVSSITFQNRQVLVPFLRN